MASADKSLEPENFDDNRTTDASSSCLNDPNYAIICVFLQKFGSLLKIEHPDFLRLQKMIENTDEVHDELKQFFVRLLRKTRKSVQPDKLDSALAKFCYTYSSQDAWEIERFGYKRASLSVKLRVLKEVLESQFDKNPNFKTSISGQTANELRSQPLGKDRLGNAYWSIIDEQCNLRVYQEHLDEEIWKVVATNRDEMVKLIGCLRSNELVMPSMIGIIDEDSSSNSMTPKLDALQTENRTITNGNGSGSSTITTTNGNNDGDDKNVPCLKIKLNPGGGESTVEQISNGDNTNGAKNQNNSMNAENDEEAEGEEEEEEEDDEDASAMSEIDELSLAASESSATTAGTKSTETQGSKRISLLASKPPSNANKLKLKIYATDKKVLKRNLEMDSKTPPNKSKRPTLKKSIEDDDSEYGSEEMTDEMSGDDMSSDDDDDDASSVGPAIEEPTMYVHGTGSGADNKCENKPWLEETEVSEAIEEDVFYVYGEGSGYDCDVGNNDVKTTEPTAASNAATEPASVQSKPMFFFGQAGCLKLSPMKTAGSNDNASTSETSNSASESVQSECAESVESEKLENEKITSEKSQSEKSSSANDSETAANDSNSVALDVNVESVVVENVTNNDETDRAISLGNETVALDVPTNNVQEKIECIEATSKDDSDLQTTESKMEEQTVHKIDPNDTNIVPKGFDQNTNVVAEQSEQPEQSISAPNADADVINECSQDNIESNSSVALKSLSVQEDSEKIGHESLPPIEDESMAIENQLSNEKIDEKSENCDEEQVSTPQAITNEIKNDKMLIRGDENEPIGSDESNNLPIENQSSVIPESTPNLDTEETSKDAAPTDVVPNENQTLIQSDSSKNVDVAVPSEQTDLVKETTSTEDTSNEIESTAEPDHSDQTPVVEEIIVAKKAYLCGPETQESQETGQADTPVESVETAEKLPEIEQQTMEKEQTNTLGCSDNQEDEKTESPIEHNLNINESNTMECTSPDQDANLTEKIPCIETPSEGESSQISPVEIPTVSPHKPIEELNKSQTINELVNESVETNELHEVQDIPLKAIENIVTESAPSECSEEQATNEPAAAEPCVPVEVKPVASESNDSNAPNAESIGHIQETTDVHHSDAIEHFENVDEITEVTKKQSAIPEPDEETILQKPAENTEVEASNQVASPLPTIEKRKSITQVDEPTECKKVCEENILIESQQPPTVEVNIAVAQAKTEVPEPTSESLCSKKYDEIVHHQSSNKIEVQNLSIEKPSTDDAPETVVPTEKNDQSLENSIENLHENSKLDEPKVCPLSEQNEQVIPVAETSSSEKIIEPVKNEIAVNSAGPISEKDVQSLEKIELPSPIKAKDERAKRAPPLIKEKIQLPPSSVPQSTRLRNRKRRISTEKVRHSSESDDNVDPLIESAISRDASSDEQVGGKRIKMRPKATVRRTTRQSIEQKRNVKDTDWSSDENDKPNAKRATNDSTKEKETSKPAAAAAASVIKAEKNIPDEDVKPIAQKVQSVAVVEEIEAQKETTNVVIETKIKAEEQEEETGEPTADQQSEEEKATPTRRGRPARRGRKPGPKPKAKPKSAKEQEVKEEKTKQEKDEKIEQNEPSIKEESIKSTPSTESPTKPETRRKKRSILGLDIAEVETIQAAADNDTPVRQSRRIAQIKIREEADRRKAEEIALQKMKEASEKKKKGVVQKQSASEEENSESEAKLEKKKRRKKGSKDKPWQTDSEVDSSEREEEDVYEHEDVERLPPLGSDHEFSPESDIEDESQIVPTKRARTARKDKTERREESSEEEEDIHACQKCSKSDHPEWILLCDKCDKGYHCSCLIPVLFVIPEGNWFCPPCQQEKLIDELESKLIEFDNLVKQKEVEEAQRQRILLNTISEANVIQDSKRDRQRARAAEFGESEESDDGSSGSSSDEESENERPVTKSSNERSTRSRPTRQQRRHISESSEHSSSDHTSDNEPIYKLRKRRQATVSYRFNEYDELINRAIKKEMDEVAGAGNLGRGKDITTIMEADKEEKRLKKLEQQQKERELAGEVAKESVDSDDDQPLKIKEDKSDGSDSEPIRPKAIKRAKNTGRKKKKLNSLDVDSEEEDVDSDDDFKGSSDSEDEEEDDSTPDSESSLDSIVKKKRKNRGISTRRSGRERKKRYDADFIDDSSFDDEDNMPLVKKKKKVDSDFSDFDGSSEEIDEEVDSEDLCDDSTDSDRSWGKRKSKKPAASKGKEAKTSRKKKPDGERAFKGKTAKKKPKLSDDDDDDDDASQSDDEYGDEVLPKSRRTRGKKLPYLLDEDFDSSDDGIKPGVKRPDTPPEERAAFIKKQEEIKRMLAEKRDEGLEKIPPPVKGSLSTIPPQIIQTAKALDVDLKKSALLNKTGSDNDSNGFDDDLPEDFDPEDMDEDAIAKMMEEEEFAQQQLKLAGETIRNRKLKDTLTVEPPLVKKDEPPSKLTIETAPSVIMQPTVPPSLVSPLPMSTSQLTIPDIPASMYTAQFPGAHSKMPITPKKRGRKIKDDILPIDAKESAPPHPHVQSQQQPPQQQHHAVHVQQPPPPSSSHRLPAQPPLTTSIQMSSIVPPNKANTLLNIPSVLQQTPAISQLFASPTIQHTSSVIAHASVIQQQQQQQSHLQQQQQQRTPLPPMSQSRVSALLGLGQNRDPIIPSTVLDVQNTRLLDPSELVKPPDELLDPSTKKRARRKKVTPTRDSLITSPPNATVSPGISQPTPVTIPNVPNVSKPLTSILSERLQSGNPVDKQSLSIATPPQLYTPSSRSQPSVITRLSRPAQRQPFPTGQSQPQRYYAPNTSVPPHSSISVASTGSHSRPYHTPNVTTATSGPRPPPLVPPTHTSGHLPHPMYMRGQPGIYGGYPNIQPPPMHRSLQSIGEHATNTPQNFTAGPYQNIPFGSYYAAAAAAERRSGAIIGTFEPFDNKNPSSHDRLPAYAHPGLGLATLASRNTAAAAAAAAVAAASGAGGASGGSPSGDDRTGTAVPGIGGSTSEFSGLVSYFSSQQDDLDA